MSEEYRKGEYLISTNKAKIKTHVVHNFLKESYWAKGIPFDTVKKTIKNSFCFGLYNESKQIGFARIISDNTSFVHLCDVFILEDYQRNGLGTWLMDTIMGHPKLQNIKSWTLATKDAHKFYAKYGFNKIDNPDHLMKLSNSVGYGE